MNKKKDDKESDNKKNYLIENSTDIFAEKTKDCKMMEDYNLEITKLNIYGGDLFWFKFSNTVL